MIHLPFRKRATLPGFLIASLLMVCPVAAADGDDNNQTIRAYANGAGPAAIFRFGRQDHMKRDVFAVVDPALWRIQFFTLDDPSADGLSFRKRFKKRGDCLLPPTFRLWRVHQHENRVVLQSQPTVPVKALIFKNGEKPESFSFRALSLPAAAADVERAASGKPAEEDSKPGTPCSLVTDMEKLPLFTSSDAAVTVTGGADEAFSVSRINPPQELGEFGRRKLPLAVEGRYLVSAQELEYARANGAPVRHFLVTTRTAMPGFVSTEVVLVRRSTADELHGRMRINLGLSRVKMGHRNVAISSTGEVLVMGTFDKEQFRVHLCQFKNKKAEDTRCTITDDPVDPAGEPAPEVPPAQNAPSAVMPSASALWQRAFQYSELRYTVDIGKLPDDCTRLRGEDDTASCKVEDLFPWTPLSELRLATGSKVPRKGVPYAQNPGGLARPTFKATDKIGAEDHKPLRDINASPPFVFGDIENSSKTRESDDIVVFGIDCSAFLAQLWGIDHVATEKLIDRANKGTDNEIKRLGGIEEARIGAAFVINISGEKTLLNHVVLFQDDENRSGPTDSSRAILVVESSSSCGGVCWSFYDESFFHGWGIIKHESSKGPLKNSRDIPKSVAEWTDRFAK